MMHFWVVFHCGAGGGGGRAREERGKARGGGRRVGGGWLEGGQRVLAHDRPMTSPYTKVPGRQLSGSPTGRGSTLGNQCLRLLCPQPVPLLVRAWIRTV